MAVVGYHAMEVLFLLFGLAALLAVAGTISDGPEAEPEPPEDDENERSGTDGDDIMFSDGGEILRGLDGDDTLITSGDSTLLGGEGDDTLVSFGGGALLNGGAGEDTFVINLLGVTDEGDLLDVNGQPVAPTVIDDFNPDQDQLVIDLRNSGLLPDDGAPVVLTGVVAPDGEGLMIQFNGVNVVQLSTYGSVGDEGMQLALEALVNDFDALQIIGADFDFPERETELPEGVEVIEDDFGALTFVVTDEFAGGGVLVGSQGIPDVLDLSQFSGGVSIYTNETGDLVLEISTADAPVTTLVNIHNVILGPGVNQVDASDIPVPLNVTVTEGTNSIIGGTAGIHLSLEGGTNTVSIVDGGRASFDISGGENRVTLSDGTPIQNAGFADIFIQPDATGTTTVSGGNASLSFAGLTEMPDLNVILTEESGTATWEGGRVDLENVIVVIVGDGATVDASARVSESTVTIASVGASTNVIGSAGPDIMIGQGNFSGGAGNDQITLFNYADGGATADGGAGDDTLIADISDDFSGDLVLSGGDGTDSFVVQIDTLRWDAEGGIARITDLEDGETVRLDVTTYQFTSTSVAPPEITVEPDPVANEVRVFVNGELALVIEGRSLLEPGMLQANVTLIRDFDDVFA